MENKTVAQLIKEHLKQNPFATRDLSSLYSRMEFIGLRRDTVERALDELVRSGDIKRDTRTIEVLTLVHERSEDEIYSMALALVTKQGPVDMDYVKQALGPGSEDRITRTVQILLTRNILRFDDNMKLIVTRP